MPHYLPFPTLMDCFVYQPEKVHCRKRRWLTVQDGIRKKTGKQTKYYQHSAHVVVIGQFSGNTSFIAPGTTSKRIFLLLMGSPSRLIGISTSDSHSAQGALNRFTNLPFTSGASNSSMTWPKASGGKLFNATRSSKPSSIRACGASFWPPPACWEPISIRLSLSQMIKIIYSSLLPPKETQWLKAWVTISI